MNYRTTNVICLLLAVAGISFGVGQTVGEDRAEAEAQSAKVQRVRDLGVQRQLLIIFEHVTERLDRIEAQTHATCLNARALVPSDPFSGSPPTCPRQISP